MSLESISFTVCRFLSFQGTIVANLVLTAHLWGAIYRLDGGGCSRVHNPGGPNSLPKSGASNSNQRQRGPGHAYNPTCGSCRHHQQHHGHVSAPTLVSIVNLCVIYPLSSCESHLEPGVKKNTDQVNDGHCRCSHYLVWLGLMNFDLNAFCFPKCRSNESQFLTLARSAVL